MNAWARMYSLHSGVKEVKMVQNGIRQEGISHLLSEGLKHTKSIKILDLQDNTFTILGSRALAGVISGWTEIVELGVGDSLLGAKGGVLVANALAKGSNKNLEILRLQFNDLTSTSLEAFVKATQSSLPALRKVEITGNKFSEENAHLETLKDLLEARKEETAGDVVVEDDWGLDSLSDLEGSDSDEDEEEEEEKQEQEHVREKLIQDAEEAQEEPVIGRKDPEVDDLAKELEKKVHI